MQNTERNWKSGVTDKQVTDFGRAEHFTPFIAVVLASPADRKYQYCDKKGCLIEEIRDNWSENCHFVAKGMMIIKLIK